MGKYALGIDFGTLSARALIADVDTGREVGEAVMDYPHGVMDRALPDGAPLPTDWALQHPADYLACLQRIVPEALAREAFTLASAKLPLHTTFVTRMIGQ